MLKMYTTVQKFAVCKILPKNEYVYAAASMNKSDIKDF